MTETVIVSATRTAIGSFQGALAEVGATKLGSIAIAEALKRAGLSGEDVNEVIMGNVLTSGIGQAPARQATLYAGLPQGTPALTIGKVCGSGLKAVMLADQIIRSGDSEVIIAGGMENMSQSPYLLPKARNGYRMGHGEIIDSMIKDGLWDVYNNFHMGTATEMCAKKYEISREDQDKFAALSYTRAQKSVTDGVFQKEIVPVSIESKKGTVIFDKDEEPFKGNIEKLATLRPAFDKAGTVTAGNASGINDGAAAFVLMSAEAAKKKGLKPLARIIGQAQASLDPAWFSMGPAEAIKKNLAKLNLKTSDIDLWEINEAFAAVAIANNKVLGLSEDRVNIRGGAVALGHPIGASGARVLVTLVHALLETNAKRGLASLCIGGGEGVSLVIERL
ncbi:MAG: acetyl-CoA C-acetyltransferase [Deltaproteobacteria bacterium]|nr:MAG: acetyl-CoA C-acetyltransferase [Deltaproteobacteria bacterium]